MDQKFNPLIKKHLDKSTVFRDISVIIQNDLIFSIAEILKDAIFHEIQETKFVAIMLDETFDISNKFQLSTLFRYFSVNKKNFIGLFL